MIAYDVNDAPRQQLFPPERARRAAGPDTITLKSWTRLRDAKERTIVMAFQVIELDSIQAGATKSSSTHFTFEPISVNAV